MTPDRFLQKLVDVLGMIKAPVIIIICAIAIIQVIFAVFLSLGRLIIWMADFFGRQYSLVTKI